MCRIAGLWFWKQAPEEERLKAYAIAMRDSLAHGGPDAAGVYLQSSIALAHRRLSIIDLSEQGNQPMHFKQWCIVYNGEIYNYKKLKEELQQQGYRFTTQSDTEVLLKAWDWKGKQCLEHLSGMWAFALWNKEKKELILVRDRFGVKPLYYWHTNHFIAFASELRAFLQLPFFQPTIDLQGLSYYLQYGFIPAPYTIFQAVKKLPPGHLLTCDADGKLHIEAYWKPYPIRSSYKPKSFQEAKEHLRHLLKESFEYRLVADVPVGIFLSGGIDSALLTCVLSQAGHELKTYTIAFEEPGYDESHRANFVAKKMQTQHNVIKLSIQEALKWIPKLPQVYDEPFGDSAALPLLLLCHAAAKTIKVALSGDGADELFLGYERYLRIPSYLFQLPFRKQLSWLLQQLSPTTLEKIYRRLPWVPKLTNFRDKYEKLQRLLWTSSLLEAYEATLAVWGNLRSFWEDAPSTTLAKSLNGTPLLQFRVHDLHFYLPDDLMVKGDRASMHVALELREPYLEPSLWNFAASLPKEYLYKNRQGKYLLKALLADYLGWDYVQAPKQGFMVPIYEWLKTDLYSSLEETLLDESFYRHFPMFQKEKVLFLLGRLRQGAEDMTYRRLWLLYQLSLWAWHWLRKDKSSIPNDYVSA